MQKKLLRLMLSMAIALTMCALMESVVFATDSAEEITYDELYQADSLTLSGGNKYTFNNGMKITGNLVIENCEVEVPAGGIEVTSGSITINNAKVTVTRNDTYSYGIYVKAGTLNIKDSTVQVTMMERSYDAINAYAKINAANSNIGIIVYNGNGINCSANSDSDVIIDNCNMEIYTPEGYGISAYRGSLLMTDSRASLDCGNTGLSCDNMLELKNCITTVAGGKVKALVGGQPDAIFASDSVLIDGGSLTASSKYSNGIYANDDVTITNSTDYVSATGATYGIKAGTEYHKGSISIGDELAIKEPANGRYNADGGYIEDNEGTPASKVVIKSDGLIKVNKPVYKGDIKADGKTHYMSEFYDLSRMPKDTMFRITVEGGYALINLNDLYAFNGADPVNDSFTIVLPEGYVFDDGKSELVCPFKILAAGKPSVSIKNNITSYKYTGKAIKPVVSVKCGNIILQKGTDYSIAYSTGCKNVGSYTITVSFKGKYSGTVKKTFKIIPATPTINSISIGTKKMTVKMTTKPSSKGASAYQIYYKQKGTSTWKKTTSTSYYKTIKSLKKGKYYYVKVRAYKKVGTKTYYGAWSKTMLSKKIK